MFAEKKKKSIALLIICYFLRFSTSGEIIFLSYKDILLSIPNVIASFLK